MRYHPSVSRILTLLALLAWPGGLLASSPESVLPATLAGWERTELHQYTAAKLEQLGVRNAPIWREYGATAAERATYRLGPQQLAVTAFAMRDSSGAYGAATYFGAGGQPANLGGAGWQSPGEWVFYESSYFVTVAGSPTPEAFEAVQALAGQLAGTSTVERAIPSLSGFLPRQQPRPLLERYVLGPVALERLAPLGQGDWVGFAYGAESLWAEYSLDDRPVGFLLVSYPTPQLAGERLRLFEDLFNLNGTGDPAKKLVYAKRAGPLLGLLVGTESGSSAARLLSQLRYEFQVTWSEPDNDLTASEWARTVVNTFIGTGLLLLYATACGLLFAGARLLIQRYLPGMVFDRPEDIEIICLDLRKR